MATRKLTDKTMVEVWNNSIGSVGYRSDVSRVRRLWDKPNTVKKISLEELKELVNTTGGHVLLNESILLIKDNDVREELSLPLIEEYIYDDTKISELLNKDAKEIETVLSNMPESLREKVVYKAIELEVTDIDKMEVLKDQTGIDVYTAIQTKREEQKEKEEKAKSKTTKK